jgi:hypothetical protein
MNCDQVFDVLTRGPFPTGTSCDVPVEAHLNECAECRRLAEALRPAIELFQEAVDPEESRDLPGYWCTSGDARTSVSYASEVESRKRPRVEAREALFRHSVFQTAWRLAAMLLLGVSLGLLASGRWVLDGSWSPFGAGAAVAPAPNAPKGEQPLAEQMQLAVLPAACLRSGSADTPRQVLHDERMLAGIELANLSCCSGCHHAGTDAAPARATVRVAQSCQLYHAGRP